MNKIGIQKAELSPEALLFARQFIATICIAVIFRKKLQSSYRKGDWKGGAIAGGFFVAATMFQTYGLPNTSPGVAAFLTTTYVVIVPLLWWALKKEKPSKIIAVCSVLAVIGIGLLSLTEGMAMKPGDMLVLVCAFMFSGCIMEHQYLCKRYVTKLLLAFLMFLFMYYLFIHLVYDK